MTDAEIYAAIQGDPEAGALADAGNDTGCAARLVAILPSVLAPTHLTTRGLYAAFDAQGDARRVLVALRTIAALDPATHPEAIDIATALEWMQPANGGVDLANPLVRGMLDAMAAAGAITTSQAGTLKALAERPVTVTHADVSRAMRPARTANQGA